MRTASITRNTSETQIGVSLNLDGTGSAKLATGLPFLDHMLNSVLNLRFHALYILKLIKALFHLINHKLLNISR